MVNEGTQASDVQLNIRQVSEGDAKAAEDYAGKEKQAAGKLGRNIWSSLRPPTGWLVINEMLRVQYLRVGPGWGLVMDCRACWWLLVWLLRNA